MTYVERRRAVSDFILNNHPELVTPLEGRLYPNSTRPNIQAITQIDVPEAYANGAIKPTGLVIDDAAIRMGPHEMGSEMYFRIVLWQYDGRALIDELAEKIGVTLQGKTLTTIPGAFYFQWAGNGPSSLDDPSQNNAPMAWVRFQVARVIRL